MVPPVRLTDEVLTLLLANMRNPDERRGDLRAQLARAPARGAAPRRALRATGPRGGRGGDGRAVRVLGAARARRDRRASRTVASRQRTCSRPPRASWSSASPSRSPAKRSRSTSPARDSQHPGNLNCPIAVTRSAAYFVVRCLTDPDVPASGGAFAPVTVTAPEGSLVNARRPAAVVAGNVETSSRIADVLFRAFGAGSPGARPRGRGR